METNSLPFQVRPGITEYEDGSWRVTLLDGKTVSGKLVQARWNDFSRNCRFQFLMLSSDGRPIRVTIESTNMSDRYKVVK